MPWRRTRAGPVQEAEAGVGTPVRLRGTIWGRPCAGMSIVQLLSGALAAVPLEDIEPAQQAQSLVKGTPPGRAVLHWPYPVRGTAFLPP